MNVRILSLGLIRWEVNQQRLGVDRSFDEMLMVSCDKHERLAML